MIAEFSVAVTDAILAVFCLLMAHIANKLSLGQRAAIYCAEGFLIWCSAAALGAFRHALGPELPWIVERGLWCGSYLFVGLGMSVFSWGLLGSTMVPTSVLFHIWVTLRFGFDSLGLIVTGSPGIVFANIAVSLLVAICISSLWLFSGEILRGRSLAIGLTLITVATAFQQGFLVGTQGVAHNNLFHLIMIPAVFTLTVATLSLPDAVE
jgi:uncharacterized protein DUF6962